MTDSNDVSASGKPGEAVPPPPEELYLCQRCQKPISDADEVYIHPGPNKSVRSHASCISLPPSEKTKPLEYLRELEDAVSLIAHLLTDKETKALTDPIAGLQAERDALAAKLAEAERFLAEYGGRRCTAVCEPFSDRPECRTMTHWCRLAAGHDGPHLHQCKVVAAESELSRVRANNPSK